MYCFLGKEFGNLFFPGQVPPKFFFLVSSGPIPRSLMVVPLKQNIFSRHIPEMGDMPIASMYDQCAL